MIRTADPLILPGWAERIARRYAAGISHLFLLHGNLQDRVEEGANFPTLDTYLDRLLCHRELVLRVHPSAGLRASPPAGAERIAGLLRGLQARGGQLDPLDLVDRILSSPVAAEMSSAVILEEAGAWLPSLPNPGAAVRTRVTRVLRWASDPPDDGNRPLFLLLSRHLSDLARRVAEAPSGMETVEVPRPDADLRGRYLRSVLERRPELRLRGGVERMAGLAGGLALEQIEDVLLQARGEGEAVTAEHMARRKIEIINQEYGDIVEVVRPRYGLEAVGGYGYVRSYLKRVARHMRTGQRRHVPMGIIIMGPPGTGKSFMVECFAKECGLLVVKAKTLRSKWVGESERNQERFFSILRALAPVVVIIDESESQEGARDPDGPSGSEVDSRLRARSLQLWGDTSNRGRIVRIDITNWPQMIDPAMRRSGRTDAKIPMLMPTLGDREAILRVLVKKHGLQGRGLRWSALAERTEGFTPANLEQLILIADEHSVERRAGRLAMQDLEFALSDFILPRQNRKQVESMTLAALEEASRRSLMPAGAEELRDRLRRRREGVEP